MKHESTINMKLNNIEKELEKLKRQLSKTCDNSASQYLIDEINKLEMKVEILRWVLT